MGRILGLRAGLELRAEPLAASQGRAGGWGGRRPGDLGRGRRATGCGESGQEKPRAAGAVGEGGRASFSTADSARPSGLLA